MSLQAVKSWEEQEAERQSARSSSRAAARAEDADGGATQFVAYVPLPDQKAIEQLVLEKKKQDLLAKYTSNDLQRTQDEAKALLNKR